MAKKKLPFVQFFIKKNNIKAKPYIMEDGTVLPYRALLGNGGRWILTGHNKHDRKLLEGNAGLLSELQRKVA